MTSVLPWRIFLLTTAFLFAAAGLPSLGQLISAPGSEKPSIIAAPSSERNYTTITNKHRQIDKVWLQYNRESANHPDAALIPREQPVPGAVEILAQRTRSSRFYVDPSQPGRVFSQSAYGALHYQKEGIWLTIDPRLSKVSKHRYEASHQQEPVGFDLEKKRSYIRTTAGDLYFNQWALYGRKGGKKELLAYADWKNHTVGDDGVFVTDFFPGVDAEMTVDRGEIKTNLIVRKWEFSQFQDILLVDRYAHSTPPQLFLTEATENNRGVSEVNLKINGNTLALIGKALAYSSEDNPESFLLPYEIEGSSLGIALDFHQLNRCLAKGPLIIDPRVTGAASRYEGITPLTSNNASSDNISNCSANFEEGCSFEWQVEVPARATVTNVIFQAVIETIAPCTRDKMNFKYWIGDAQCGNNITWETRGRPATPGSTGGDTTATSLYNTCFTPTCVRSFARVRLSILRLCMGSPGCAADCVRGTGPFIVTVEGRTLELTSGSVLQGNQLCYGEEVQLAAVARYGLPDYQYQWAPGNLTRDTISVKPDRDTEYRVIVTDRCGESVENRIPLRVSAPARSDSVNLEACGKLIFEGREYLSTQIIMDTLRGRWGCDSLFRTIKLKVHPLDPKNETLAFEGCEFVEYGGNRYFQSTVLNETIKNANECDSIYRKVNIQVEGLELSLSSSVGSDSLYIGKSVQLLATANRRDFRIVAWEPPHLFSDSSLKTQEIIVPEDLTYTVVAETDDGCTDVATLRIRGKEIPDPTLYPNSFSPNGDGQNDVWKPLRQIDKIEVWVYNRWGECVFYSNEPVHQWDGTFKGTKVPPGVYAFRFIAYGKFESTGVVTVLH